MNDRAYSRPSRQDPAALGERPKPVYETIKEFTDSGITARVTQSGPRLSVQIGVKREGEERLLPFLPVRFAHNRSLAAPVELEIDLEGALRRLGEDVQAFLIRHEEEYRADRMARSEARSFRPAAERPRTYRSGKTDRDRARRQGRA